MTVDELARRVIAETPEPTAAQTHAARTRLRDAIRTRPRPSHPRPARRLVGGAATAAGLAGAAVFLVVAMPRGTDDRPPATGPTAGRVPIGALDRLVGHGSAPGRIRTLPTGERVLAARTPQGRVCMDITDARGRIDSNLPACAAEEDLARGILVGRTWRIRPRWVLLTADGVRLTTLDGTPLPTLDNVTVVAGGVRRVRRVQDGTAAIIRLDVTDEAIALPAGPRDPATVPDLTGLDPWTAYTVLRAGRLYDGHVETRVVHDGTPPGRVVGQSDPPGTRVADRAEVGLVVSTPAGPGGTRPMADPSAPLMWTGPRPAGDPSALEQLRGNVVVLALGRPAAVRTRHSAWGGVDQRLGTRPTVVAVAVGGSAAQARGMARSWDAPAAIADPRGALAASLGVTSLPATVVLDRQGRVAVRQHGLPPMAFVPGRPFGDLLQALGAEPAPQVPGEPHPLPGVLARRAPVPSAQVPVILERGSPCGYPAPQRAWRFGPSRGLTLWVGWYPTVHGRPGPTLGYALVPDSTRGSHQSYVPGGGCRFDFSAVGRDPAVALGGRAFLVDDGLVEARVDGGPALPVRDGLLVVPPSVRLPGTAVFTGPAGRRVQRLDGW